MSTDEGKKTFVIKHTFNDFKNMKNHVWHYGKEEKHFGIPWQLHICKDPEYVDAYLKCAKFAGVKDWSIDITIDAENVASTEPESVDRNRVFSRTANEAQKFVYDGIFENYLVDGNLTIECQVTINKIDRALKPNLRIFDNESAKEFSDVVLKVKDQKFYVNKMYLACHSTYFKALFTGNFDESKQSEVELKDIDPQIFQKFLEILYGESAVEDDSVEEILELADMYDSKTANRRCEEFLVHRSKQDLKFKFCVAVKYNMDELKGKCISEMKTVEDILPILPEDDAQFGPKIWRGLMDRTIDLYKNKQ